MLSKLTDIESGLIIPIRSIKIEDNIDGDYETMATVSIPIEEIFIDEIEPKFIIEVDKPRRAKK